jgi:hypothetical protein
LRQKANLSTPEVKASHLFALGWKEIFSHEMCLLISTQGAGLSPDFSPRVRKSGASQAAEKPSNAVILSEAKDRTLSIFKAVRDSSSPVAPQNDSAAEFFRSL